MQFRTVPRVGTAPTVRRMLVGLGAAAAVGATLLTGAPAALADDAPPNCTAADLAGVQTGVQAATSAYLFTHPEVNFFYTSLEGLSREQARARVATYLAANPGVKSDLEGVRAPLVDIKNRCGAPAP